MTKMNPNNSNFDSLFGVLRYLSFYEECMNQRRYIKPVFHYTSSDGFLSIMGGEKPQFWFSKYDCMNDENEGKEYERVLERILEYMVATGDLSSTFADLVKQIEPRGYFTYLEKSGDIITTPHTIESEKYILCASKDKDSLPLWNYYVKNDKYQGYNIEIDLEDSSYYGTGKGYLLEKHEVRYYDEGDFDVNEYSDILKLLKALFNLYKENEGSDYNPANDLIADLKEDIMLTIKNKCFIHENEVRWILDVPKDCSRIKRINNSKEVETFTKKYRSAHGYIVPYVELSVNKSDIFSVGMGPLIYDDAAEKTLQGFLTDKKYECVEIRKSVIPIRY